MFDIDQYLISIQRLYDKCGPYLMINYEFKFKPNNISLQIVNNF